ncbi:phage small terminase subunit [Rhodobiaceae bacterium]|nr:phage small terminase subunit [Rhodobiaceae bacterium]
MSLARTHYQKTLAAKAAKQAAESDELTMENLNAYEQHLGQLQTHMAQLKNTQSQARKIEMKQGFISDYDAYVDGILAEAPGLQDEVMVTQMIWRLDAGQFDRAYEIAGYALEHGLVMPERFNRTLPTYLAEEFAEAAIQADGKDDRQVPPVKLLVTLLEDLKEADMPDQVRAKLHKAIAFGLEEENEPQALLTALEHYDRTIELNPTKNGVKKRREQLVKRLEKETSNT